MPCTLLLFLSVRSGCECCGVPGGGRRPRRRYEYVTEELPELLGSEFGSELDTARASIFGHSMGGHGALVCALKNPGKYRSVSAFSPICNPTQCPWGEKARRGSRTVRRAPPTHPP